MIDVHSLLLLLSNLFSLLAPIILFVSGSFWGLVKLKEYLKRDAVDIELYGIGSWFIKTSNEVKKLTSSCKYGNKAKKLPERLLQTNLEFCLSNGGNKPIGIKYLNVLWSEPKFKDDDLGHTGYRLIDASSPFAITTRSLVGPFRLDIVSKIFNMDLVPTALLSIALDGKIRKIKNAKVDRNKERNMSLKLKIEITTIKNKIISKTISKTIDSTVFI